MKPSVGLVTYRKPALRIDGLFGGVVSGSQSGPGSETSARARGPLGTLSDVPAGDAQPSGGPPHLRCAPFPSSEGRFTLWWPQGGGCTLLCPPAPRKGQAVLSSQ